MTRPATLVGRNFVFNFSWSSRASRLLADYGQPHTRGSISPARIRRRSRGGISTRSDPLALTADGSAKPTRDAALPVTNPVTIDFSADRKTLMEWASRLVLVPSRRERQ